MFSCALGAKQAQYAQIGQNKCFHLQIQLSDYEPAVVASVLKQFLRELPDPVLTNHLMLRFEEVSASSNPQKRIEGTKLLLAELPECNRLIRSTNI